MGCRERILRKTSSTFVKLGGKGAFFHQKTPALFIAMRSKYVQNKTSILIITRANFANIPILRRKMDTGGICSNIDMRKPDSLPLTEPN